jgi:hypothetical protein
MGYTVSVICWVGDRQVVKWSVGELTAAGSVDEPDPLRPAVRTTAAQATHAQNLGLVILWIHGSTVGVPNQKPGNV